ncbi:MULTISPECIES: APC family permease [unclassified Streptomyces]|uniref:APC family permease n=1 Tax=unclassified Streptomyces TaxID=2593676 RepID=UPI000F4EF306|nr:MULTISPECIES: APC family permease [unclassified Streptomyces]MDH6455234.1 fructoselysine transporter [Streptomyces sp. SAI-119]MDH6494213.1 fructoselysine transporter [Streptomyces sp. SAI-149]QUC58606.1 APC family permease [Streptomyces sp. A2-16]
MSGSPPPSGGFVRRVGLFQATAINMSQMCGIGPFVTIPLMVAAFGGPQAVVGFIAGALLALADGLVWAEMGAAMPGSGGSYVYLRQAFQYRTGRLMPFLFVWTAMLFIPLIMSTGVVGFVQYLGYLAPDLGQTPGDLVGLGVIALVVILLWRGIEHIARITAVMWAVMITSVLLVIVAAASDFSAHLAFTYPAHAFDLGSNTFWIGFAGGLTIGIYDYLGYNTTAYMGAEIKDPGRNLPRSIIFSILGIMAIYLLLQIGTLGVIDWHRMTDAKDIASTSVASAVLEETWGKGAADTVTVLILITAFASVFTGLLGGSRVPYDAARDRVFFRPYAKLHPKHRFPTLGLATMGVITAIGFLIGRHTDLATLIQLLTTVMVIVQALAQIVALSVLRRRQPTLRRPYRMWLYPVPSVIAFVGWCVIYGYADKNSPGRHPIEWSLAWLALGCVAYVLWARFEKVWPFGPKEITEDYLTPEPARAEPAGT